MDWRLSEVIAGSRGGPTRARIISALHDRPRNPHQLASDLHLNYKTVNHHLDALVEADILIASGQQYGAIYLPTRYVRRHWDAAERLLDEVLTPERNDDSD